MVRRSLPQRFCRRFCRASPPTRPGCVWAKAFVLPLRFLACLAPSAGVYSGPSPINVERNGDGTNPSRHERHPRSDGRGLPNSQRRRSANLAPDRRAVLARAFRAAKETRSAHRTWTWTLVGDVWRAPVFRRRCQPETIAYEYLVHSDRPNGLQTKYFPIFDSACPASTETSSS
jgi:hypothetical protein